MTRVWKDIEDKKFSPLYVLYGSEEFLIQKTVKLIVEHALNPDEAEFNLTTIDLEETAVEVAIEELEMVPFFGEQRVVLLQNAFFLTAADRKSDKITHDIDRLLAYVSNPVNYSIGVFVVPYPKLDERKKVTKELIKKSTVFEAKQLNDFELADWVRVLAKEHAIVIEPKAIEALVYLTGNNLQMILLELEKLSLGVEPGQAITEKDVEATVSKTLDQNVFDLVDKIVHQKKLEAIGLYHDLLIQKEEPIRILAAIARQFRIFAQVKYLIKCGLSTAQIAKKLKMNPYPVKLAMQQIHLFNEEDLLSKIDALAEMDFQMKTGQGDKEIMIDMFILKA